MENFEEELMSNAHVLVDAGLMSVKDLVGIVLELEKSRATGDGGVGDDLPGDRLAEWLNDKEAVN